MTPHGYHLRTVNLDFDLDYFFVLFCLGFFQTSNTEKNHNKNKKKTHQKMEMQDDDDVIMIEDFVPSEVHKSNFLYFPSTGQVLIACAHGKWLMFAPRGAPHDKLWLCTKQFVLEGRALCAKTSTAKPNAHTGDSGEGVIMVYCGDHLSKNEILQVGKELIQFTKYKSRTRSYLYYKSEIETKNGSKYNSNDLDKSHYTYAIDLLAARMHDEVKCSMPLTKHRDTNIASYFAQVKNYPKIPYICVMSLNVWLENIYVQERMHAICETVRKCNPDVVMLQEVTAHSFSILDPLLKAMHFATRSIQGKKFTEMLYFQTITVQALSFEQIPLIECTMNRELHILHGLHKPTNKKIVFATAHLEQGEHRQHMRQRQWHFVQRVLEDKQWPWILGADTNMAFYQDDGLKEYTADAWKTKMCSDATRGTWDPARNTNIPNFCKIANTVPQCRYDRFLYQRNSLDVHDFILTCTEPMSNGVFPSDHFGILSRFIPVGFVADFACERDN